VILQLRQTRCASSWSNRLNTGYKTRTYYYYYYFVAVVVIAVFSCHRPFLHGTSWREPKRPPPLKLHVSHCSTFRIKCDVPSIAVCCSESIECFPGIASWFFFKSLLLLWWLQLWPVLSHISYSAFFVPLYINCCTSASCILHFAQHLYYYYYDYYYYLL
jgi:hypothetical protein